MYGQRLKVNLFVNNQFEENLSDLLCSLGLAIKEWEMYEPEQELDKLMSNEGLPDSDSDHITETAEKEDSGIEVTDMSPPGISYTRKVV